MLESVVHGRKIKDPCDHVAPAKLRKRTEDIGLIDYQNKLTEAPLSKDGYDIIIYLLGKYLKQINEQSPLEWLDENFQNLPIELSNENEAKSIALHFNDLIRHLNCLELIVKSYHAQLTPWLYTNRIQSLVMAYFVLLCLPKTKTCPENTWCVDLISSMPFIESYLKFYSNYNNKEDHCKIANKFFDPDYICSRFSIAWDSPILETILEKVNQNKRSSTKMKLYPRGKLKKYTVKRKEVSVTPIPFIPPHKPLPIPPSTYIKPKNMGRKYQMGSKWVQKKITKYKTFVPKYIKKCRKKSVKLIRETNNETVPMKFVKQIKSKPGKVKKYIKCSYDSERKCELECEKIQTNVIKQNTTNILREAVMVVKEIDEEQEKIEKLMTSPGYLEYEKLLENFKKIEEEELIREIERKHLLGQISHEEAIMAKQRIVLENAEKRKILEAEKIQIEKELEEFKLREIEKAKEIIQNVQLSKQVAKQKMCQVYDSKKQNAKEIVQEGKQLKQIKLNQQQKELTNKINLIRQLKIVQAIRKQENKLKEIKCAEMYGMSINEIRIRLQFAKRELKNELETKKKEIQTRNKIKCQIKQTAHQLVKAARLCKKERKAKEASIDTYIKTPSQGLEELRQQFYKAKNLRMENARKLKENLNYSVKRSIK